MKFKSLRWKKLYGNKKFVRNVQIVVIIAFLWTVFYIWGGGSPARRIGGITVEGESITPYDEELAREELIKRYKKIDPNFDESKIQYEELIKETIKIKLLEKEAKKSGIYVTPEEIALEIRLSLADDASYNVAVKQGRGELLRRLEDKTKRQLLFKKLQELKSNTLVISKSELLSFYNKEFRRAKVSHLYINARELVPKDELERYYEKHKEEEFIQPQVKMQHILLPLSPSPSREEEDRVRRIIEEVVKAYQEKKVPFEALAQQISADKETGPKGGTLTPFFKGELEEKFGKNFDYGAFNAKIGELQVIRGIKGYHIIRVNSREPTTMPFMIAKRFIKEKLAPDYKKKAKRLAKWVINQIKEDKLTFEKALNLGTYSHSKKELRVCILPKLFFSPKTPMSKWEELEREELTRGRLVIPQISKAIFSLQPNQVSSKPISTPFGYHIFKLHEILEAPREEFPEYEAEAKLIYIREKQDKIFADYYKNLYKRAQIKQNKLL